MGWGQPVVGGMSAVGTWEVEKVGLNIVLKNGW